MPPPVLQTRRLTLRPFAPADAADVFAYASNPNVSRHSAWRTHRTLADAEAFVARVLARPATEPTWAIRLHDAPAVIGTIAFGPTDAAIAEVHYSLAECCWGRGLMTEAVAAALAWGWATCPEVRQVRSRATVDNFASRRVLEKNGLRMLGIVDYVWTKSARPVAQVAYAIDRP